MKPSIALLILMLAGCSQQAASPPAVDVPGDDPKSVAPKTPLPTSKAAERPSEVLDAESVKSDKVHTLTGVVRKVDRAKGEVTINHDPIPGVMGRMTMSFPIRQATDLENVEVGDRVEAKLHIHASSSELTDLTVTEPAIAPSAPATPPKRTLAVGEAVPDFAMTTQDGKTLRLSDLRGEVVVLTFIYTRCPLPDFCPLMNRKFKEIQAGIVPSPGLSEKVRLLSISFDPEHDTTEVLQKQARLQGAKPPIWTFVVASHDELRKVAPSLGLAYGPRGDEVIHNLSTAVIDESGRLARLVEGRGWTADDILKEVRSLARKPEPTP